MIWDDSDFAQIFASVWRTMAIAYAWPRHLTTRWTPTPRGKSRYLPLPRSWLRSGSDSRPPTTHHTHSRTHTMRHARTPRTARNARLAAATMTIAVAGLAAGVGLPTHTPAPAASLTAPTPAATYSCEEDMPCWDAANCAEIGNHVCGAAGDADTAWLVWVEQGGERHLPVDPSRPHRVEYMMSTPEYPQNMDTYDLALLGTDGRWYVFRAVYTDTKV